MVNKWLESRRMKKIVKITIREEKNRMLVQLDEEIHRIGNVKKKKSFIFSFFFFFNYTRICRIIPPPPSWTKNSLFSRGRGVNYSAAQNVFGGKNSKTFFFSKFFSTKLFCFFINFIWLFTIFFVIFVFTRGKNSTKKQ